jgi:hypothetical protein
MGSASEFRGGMPSREKTAVLPNARHAGAWNSTSVNPILCLSHRISQYPHLRALAFKRTRLKLALDADRFSRVDSKV